MTTHSRSWRAGVTALAILAAWACGSGQMDLFRDDPSAEASGSAAFAVALEADVTAIEYVVRDSDGAVAASERMNPEPAQGVRFTIDLPAADGYLITLDARLADGQTCSGSARFDVSPGARVEVGVALACGGGTAGPSVTGTLVSCPSVSIATGPLALAVGASLALGTSVDGALAAAPRWTASGGSLEAEGGAARFTCTAAGDVEVRLSAGEGECSASDSVVVSCAEPPASSACAGLGGTCHVVDGSSAEAHACHELGHGGDEAACAEGRAACIDTCGAALCAELSSLCHDVDPGSGPLHECHELGHAADAAACFAGGRECFELCTRAHYAPVTVRFAAQVGDEPFACGTSHDAVGTTVIGIEPQDFRFFVHDLRLITADATEVAVEIEDRAPWQALGTALLDFEDATGACLSGDAATNTQITGLAPPGEYTGIAFRLGVTESANHGDPAVQPAPLAAGSMTWGWLSGYKFLRAEVGSDTGGGVLHLGSAGCSGDPAAGSVTCARSNRPSIILDGFDAASDVIVADLGAIFAGTDLAVSTLCHSSGAACEPMFGSLGLDLASGDSAPGQSVFRVAP